MAPDARLGELLRQRRALEARIAGLAGLPGAPGDDAQTARYPVMSFAERRREQAEWAARRNALRAQQDEIRGRTGDAAGGSQPAPEPGGLAPTPLEARLGAGLPIRTDLSSGRTHLGAARDWISDRTSGLRSGIGAARRRVQEAITPVNRVADVGNDLQRQTDDAGRQLRDLDRRLAEEGVSEADRAEIRDSIGGEQISKVSGPLARANSALNAPRRAVERVDEGWQRRERAVTGAMDRFGSYAEMRDRRLSPETGGSGDLFERMRANRMAALERRREQQRAEERDQARRDRARRASAERRRDEAKKEER
ncbi:MAG TPA: hypothetical protein VLA52_07715 [Thermohalobaculum sp.]|nr:hypothetical protein [Thermohalobaculum sp.]